MRKLTARICLIMALLTASALAADAETAPTLWPAYDPETGLWGMFEKCFSAKRIRIYPSILRNTD